MAKTIDLDDDEDIETLYINETGTYFFGMDADPDEALNAETFRSNVATILKAVRIKFDYHDFQFGEFFTFLCTATEEEVKQKIDTYLEVLV